MTERAADLKPMVPRTSLDRLEQVAREAGAAILARSEAAGAADRKPDGSLVTEADRAAHQSIVSALEQWDAGIPAISEEGTIPSYETRRNWPRFWLVDPLDGTKEFVARTGEYTVNIALVEGCEPVLGVVYAPALGVMYLAGRGLGAWRRDGDGAPARI